MLNRVRLTLGLLFVFASALPLLAQNTSGSITGVVHDPTGAVIPGVKIVLINQEQGIEARQTVTNEVGLYVFSALPGATYTVLEEIGRLREVTFRAVGEGTGGSCDLDAFDQHYLHLFAWHAGRREVIGAYRLGPTDEILPDRGAVITSNVKHRLDDFWQDIFWIDRQQANSLSIIDRDSRIGCAKINANFQAHVQAPLVTAEGTRVMERHWFSVVTFPAPIASAA